VLPDQLAADSAESAGCSLLLTMRSGTSLLSSSFEAAARSSRITLQHNAAQQQQQQQHGSLI
jgi:hypothetical protein